MCQRCVSHGAVRRKLGPLSSFNTPQAQSRAASSVVLKRKTSQRKAVTRGSRRRGTTCARGLWPLLDGCARPSPPLPCPPPTNAPPPPPSRDHVAAGTCFPKVTPKRGPPLPAWSVDPGNGQTLHAKQNRLLGPLGGETETSAWPVSRDQFGLRCVAVVAVGDDSRLIV